MFPTAFNWNDWDCNRHRKVIFILSPSSFLVELSVLLEILQVSNTTILKLDRSFQWCASLCQQENQLDSPTKFKTTIFGSVCAQQRAQKLSKGKLQAGRCPAFLIVLGRFFLLLPSWRVISQPLLTVFSVKSEKGLSLCSTQHKEFFQILLWELQVLLLFYNPRNETDATSYHIQASASLIFTASLTSIFTTAK